MAMSGICFSPESARAMAVFPVPEVPTSRMPRGAVRAERHRARVDLEDLKPGLRVRDADLDLAIEASGSSERGIKNLRDVRGADHNHLTARHEAVHQTQKLRHDALLDLAGYL